MVHLIKFFALAIGVAFSGNDSDTTNSNTYSSEGEEILQLATNTSDADAKDVSTLGKGRVPFQPTHNHGCGHDHGLNVMRELDSDYDQKLKHYNEVILPQLQAEGKRLREKRRSNSNQAVVLNLPIVFHIIHKPGESIGQGQNLDDQTIIDQLETLNEDLTAQNAGWQNVPPRWADIKGNPELQFCLAEIDPQGGATSGIVRHEYTSVPDRDFIRNTIKPQTGWPTLDYYNVWILPIPGTTQFGGVLGWAYFPFPGTPGGQLDGCVQDYRFTGKGGKTLTHEVGHSFGLPHVWGNSGGCGNDDGIADTPPQETNTNSIQRMSCNGSTWPTAPSTCNGEEHMYINYMDYSPDACALTFTIGQADVMRAVTEGTHSTWASRNRLVTNASTVAQTCAAGNPTGGGNPGGGGGGPPIVLQHDAGIQTIITPTNGEFCSSEEITPVVLLTNGAGDTPLTSCTIRYKISGTPGSISFNWTGNLLKGESMEVALAPFTSPEFSFEFTAWTTSPNGEDDENGFNDEKAISLSTPDVFDPNIFEDFENENDFPTSTNLDEAEIGSSSIREWEINTEVSAYGVGDGCVYFRNSGDPDGEGTIDIIEFPVLDFSTIENPRLAFDIAYYHAETIPEKDSIRIRVSADCGDTFTTVFYKGGEDLATASGFQQLPFFPEPIEWRNEVVELFQFTGADRLVIEIMNIGYSNNNVFIDNLNLSDGCASSVQVATGDLTCGDECDGFANLILNGFAAAPQITWSNNVNGQTGESLEGLCPGSYSVTVIDTEFECEHIQEINISGPDPLELIVISNDITIPGAGNGSAIAQGFGGSEPYSFQWDDENNFEDAFLTGLRAGIYCVTITDANGCSQEDCVEITGFECGMDIEIEITQPDCGGDGIGTGFVTVTGAVGNATVFWSRGGPGGGFAFGNTNNNLTAGPLFVVVSDPGLDNCQEEFFFDIFPSVTPSINPAIENESTSGSSDGSIILNTDDDDSVYSYLWSNGETTEDIVGLAAGSYTVTINDVNNNCELIETFVIDNLNCTLTASAIIVNVTCFEDTDGSIEISAAGGSAPYDFGWPSGPNVTMQGNLAAGIYAITVSDAAGCKVIYEAIVEQPSLLDVLLATNDETNPGALDGSVSSTVIGGTAPYQYEWSNGQTGTEEITGLGGGIYLVTITDANQCTTVKGASVDGKICPTIQLITDGTDVSCFEADNGTLSAVVTGGIEPYTYLWTPGDYTTATVTDVPAGDYTLAVMDADGCPANGAFSVAQPDLFSFTLSGMNESVEGAMDGSIETTVTGGVGTISYSWTGPNAFNSITQNISSLAPAEYCLEATDENSCSFEACFTIGAGESACGGFTSESIVLEIVNNISCFGFADGSATAIVEGGTQPFNFLWSNGETDQTAINLPVGESSVVVTDDNGCVSEQLISITEPEAIALGVNVTPESSLGQADGSLMIDTNNAAEPFSCVWTGDNAFTNNDCNLTDLAPGQYCLTLTDANGCVFEDCYTVSEGNDLCAEFAIERIITTDVLCRGDETGTSMVILIGGAAPFTYEWSNLSVDEINTTLGAGDVGVTITDNNNCIVSGTATILEPEVALGSSVTGENETSPGANDGTATASASGGTGTYDYLWSGPGGFTGIQANIVDLAPGTYCVQITDENGCSVESCVDVNEADAPDCSAFGISFSSEPISCNGFDNAVLEVDVSNGVEPFTYIWNDPDLPSISTQENLGPGSYAVSVMDGNGCEATAVYEVIDPELLEVEIEVQPISGPGTDDAILTAVGSGGDGEYTVLWNDTEEGFTLGPVGPGEYCVVLVDGNGCVAEDCVIVEDATANCIDFDVELVVASQVTCFGDSDGAVQVNIISAEEPITYEWANGLDPIQQQTGLEAGVYVVTVTDANNCSTIAEVQVEQPESELVIDLSPTNVTVLGGDDGTATVVAVGGDEEAEYTYIWSDGQSTATATDLAPGDYCVTVGSGSCSAEGCVEVFAAEDLCAEFQVEESVQDVTCFGECDGTVELEIVGGQEPYRFNWSDGSTGESLVTCAEAGAVTVTDANDCQAIISFIVGEPGEIELVTSETNASSPTANDGTANAAASGGTAPFEYNWTGNREGSSIIDLEPGDYTVTVTDANNCTATSSVTVGVDEDQCIGFTGSLEVQNVSCFEESDGVINVNVEGGSGTYFYEYSNGTSLGNSLEGVAAGDFTVVVRDGNDCEITLQGTITEPEELVINVLEANDTSDDTAEDGSLIIGIEGGTEPYTVDWEDEFGDVLEVSNLGVGSYIVTVTDDNGCRSIETINIGSDDGGPLGDCSTLIASFAVTPVSCFLDSDGSIEVVVSGGTPPYDIVSNGGSLIGLASNMYLITITDDNGCVFEQEIDVPSPGQLGAEATGFDGECGSPASAQVIASGGTAPFDIVWSNGETGPFIFDLDSGIYGVTVTDDNGCTNQDEVEVTNTFIPLEIEASTTNATCSTVDDGRINITVSGGAEPYTFLWNDGVTTEDRINVGAGTYTLEITDAIGCQFVLSRTILSPGALVASYSVAQGATNTLFDVTVNATGGTPPYNYNWSDGGNNFINLGLTVGEYTVTITDDNLCEIIIEVEVEEVTSASDLDIVSSFTLSPNPTNGQFLLDVSLSQTSNMNLTIYNILGQNVITNSYRGNEIFDRLDLSNQPSGTYYVRLYNETGQLTKKLIKVD